MRIFLLGEFSAVCQGSQRRVDGHFSENLGLKGSGNLVDMALAEDGDLLAAIRTDKVAVVLHDAEYRNLHGFCHVEGLGHDHAYQILGGRNDNDAFHRKGLEDRQWYITGSWRHIHEQEVQFAPDHIAPELFYHVGDDRSSPDHRVLLVGNEKI